jgi:hypothetical protein
MRRTVLRETVRALHKMHVVDVRLDILASRIDALAGVLLVSERCIKSPAHSFADRLRELRGEGRT